MTVEEKVGGKDTNIVYVGNKPPINYVTVVMALLNSDEFDEVTLKARGNVCLA